MSDSLLQDYHLQFLKTSFRESLSSIQQGLFKVIMHFEQWTH